MAGPAEAQELAFVPAERLWDDVTVDRMYSASEPDMEGIIQAHPLPMTGSLAYVQQYYFSTIGTGGMRWDAMVFPLGEAGLVVDETTGHDGSTRRSMALDVRPHVNATTGLTEQLAVHGQMRDSWYKELIGYCIESAESIPLRPHATRWVEAFNEGTFSRSGPDSWMEHLTDYTAFVSVDEPFIQAMFRDAIDDITFRQDALEIVIPADYLPKESGGHRTTTGRVPKTMYPQGIGGVYVLEQVRDALGPLACSLGLSHTWYNANLDWSAKHRDQTLPQQYFTYGGSKGTPQFMLRIAPGFSNVVWIQPRLFESSPDSYEAGKEILQHLPAHLQERFPGASSNLPPALPPAWSYQI